MDISTITGAVDPLVLAVTVAGTVGAVQGDSKCNPELQRSRYRCLAVSVDYRGGSCYWRLNHRSNGGKPSVRRSDRAECYWSIQANEECRLKWLYTEHEIACC